MKGTKELVLYLDYDGVPKAQGFGKFREGSETRDVVVTRLRAEVAKLEGQEAAMHGEKATAPEAGSIQKMLEAWPESAAELLKELERLVALQKSDPGQFKLKINLFGASCSTEDADAVLSAANPLQAARDLMKKKLNESERK